MNNVNKLHHLSMLYVGALMELSQGKQIGLIPQGYPGLKRCRDFLDLMLFTRAEINGITQLLIDKGICTIEEVTQQFEKEYEFLAEAKAKMFGCKVTDYGLEFKVGGDN